MIQGYIGYDGYIRLYGICGIEPSAHSDFEYSDIYLLSVKMEEGSGSHKFEIGKIGQFSPAADDIKQPFADGIE